jgi:FtsZ-interacting cell division protein ZipA
MTDLQIWLIILGVAVVGGVLAFNKWQEHRHGKRAEQAFRSDTRDVLIDPATEMGGLDSEETAPPQRTPDEAHKGREKREERLPSSHGKHEKPEKAPFEERGREVEMASSKEAASHGPIAPPQKTIHTRHHAGSRSGPEWPPELRESQTDHVLCLESMEPLPRGRLWARQAELFRGLGKPVQWFVFDDDTNKWFSLADHPNMGGRWYCVALQLADRQGALSSSVYDRFVNLIDQLIDEFMLVPIQVPPREDVLSRAQALDQFCASVDIQIGVNVVTRSSPFPGTKIRGVAEACGLELREDGCFHFIDEEGKTLFVMSNLESTRFTPDNLKTLSTHGLTLAVDVPRVVDGGEIFRKMIEFANHLASALGAEVVDDNRTPLGAPGIGAIRGQVEQFQQRMKMHGFEPGSPLALRIFS